MQKTLKGDVKFSVVLRVIKQWREKQNIKVFPEVIDSILLMIVRDKDSLDEFMVSSIVSVFLLILLKIIKLFEQLSSPDFFSSILIDKAKEETLIFNYFASVIFI